MLTRNNKSAFGFATEFGYSEATDTFADMQTWKSKIHIDFLIRHMGALDEAFMCGLGQSHDVITGEYFPAGLFEDGPFVIANDVLRYLKRGDINGVPKEYEDYLIKKYGEQITQA